MEQKSRKARRMKNRRKKAFKQFVITVVILAIALFIQYKIAVSDLDPWLKFLLLR